MTVPSTRADQQPLPLRHPLPTPISCAVPTYGQPVPVPSGRVLGAVLRDGAVRLWVEPDFTGPPTPVMAVFEGMTPPSGAVEHLAVVADPSLAGLVVVHLYRLGG